LAGLVEVGLDDVYKRQMIDSMSASAIDYALPVIGRS